MPAPRGFDAVALHAAIDERRRREGLSWSGVAAAMSRAAGLDGKPLRPIGASTITGMPRRRDTSCQHALIMLRWLGCAWLPAASHAQRLRWDLRALYTALDEARRAHGATWRQTADRLRCTPHQLTGLRTAKFATSMRLAMRICQALGRPAADFIRVAGRASSTTARRAATARAATAPAAARAGRGARRSRARAR